MTKKTNPNHVILDDIESVLPTDVKVTRSEIAPGVPGFRFHGPDVKPDEVFVESASVHQRPAWELDLDDPESVAAAEVYVLSPEESSQYQSFHEKGKGSPDTGERVTTILPLNKHDET